MKITIKHSAGSKSRTLYTYADAHARRWTIELDGEVCGVIYHVGRVARRNGRLDRGEWVASICGVRVASFPARNALNGMVRRALADADTLSLVLEGAGEKADDALIEGDTERFEKYARVARILAEAGRVAAENEALEV